MEITLDPFRTWTVRDLALLPDGPRFEIVDGRLEMAPGATPDHVSAAYWLMRLLQQAAPAGVGVMMEAAVHLSDTSYRIADVGVFDEAGLGGAGLRAGDFLLLAEVVSPASLTTDRITKPAQYAEAGVRHYWRLEPARQLLVAYDLVGRGFVEVARAAGTEVLRLTRPFDVQLSPADLLR